MSKTGHLRDLDHLDPVEWQVLPAGRQPIRSSSVKIIAFDRFKPGVSIETIEPLPARRSPTPGGSGRPAWCGRTAPAPTSPGVVIVFEVASVDEAQAYVADSPMTEAGYLEWSYVARMAPVMLESQFDPDDLVRAALAPDHRKVPR